MRKQPMSHILIDSEGTPVHHFSLVERCDGRYMQSDPNNAGSLGVLFLGVFIFSIVRSHRRWKSVIYSVCGGISVILVTFLVALVFPSLNTDATGAASFDISLLMTMLISLVHSRYTRKKPASATASSTAILILSLLGPLLAGVAVGQQGQRSVSPAATSTLKNISFAWADSEGVHLASPQFADDWVRKNAKNFPTTRFSQTPVSRADNYLVVFSSSTSVLSGFQPVVTMNTTTTATDFSGRGTASDNSGSTWSYTFSGTAKSTTTTMTQQDVPYTIESSTLYATVYGGPGHLLIYRHSETIGWQRGGDSESALIYNLGQTARRIRLKTRLLNSVARDVVRFPSAGADVERESEHSAQKSAVAVPLETSNRLEKTDTGTSDAPSAVSVTSDPIGAEIYVDDSFVGYAPVTLELKPGQHSIRAFAKDFKNWSEWPTIIAASQVHIEATLKKSN
jgi:hypothetical protein